MYAFGHNKLCASGAVLALMIITMPDSCLAEEIAAYRLTDTEASFGLLYRYDANATQQAASQQSKDTRSNFEEELNVLTHGYIYHPNFLKIDLSGGFLFNQESQDDGSGEVSQDDTLYNLSTRLMFLEKKPYPLTLYYEKSHPTTGLNVSDVFVQENEKYGLNFSLRQPVSPVTLNLEAYQRSNEGESIKQVTNNRTSYQSVSAHSSFDNGSHVQFSHTKNRNESLSGTKGEPINPFSVTTKSTDLNARLIIGKEKKANLNIIASYTTHITPQQERALRERRFSPNLQLNHRDGVSSFYRYNFLDRKQQGIENNMQSAATGIRFDISKTINTSAALHMENNEATGLELDNVGAQGTIAYNNKFAFGKLNLSAGLNYDEYDRTVSISTPVKVVNTPYTLVGTTSVTLAHDDIKTNTIEVRRADTNELLTESDYADPPVGDYSVIPVGRKVQITKINPDLPTDLNVLVSYEYDPGGSANYNSFAYNLQASIELHKYFSIFMSYHDTDQTLISGEPTSPLNSSDTTRYGLKADYTLPTDIAFSLGGEVSHEKHNQNISSYLKTNSDIFMQVDLPFSSSLHLSMQRLQVDNVFSTEDVDLTRYSARLRSNPANRLTLTLQLSDEKDNGGSLPRSSKNITFTGQWRIRKLLIELAGRRVLDTQGQTKQERTVFNASLKREF